MEAAAVTVTRSAARRRRGRQLQEEQEEQEPRRRRQRQGRRIKDEEEETVFREVVRFSPDPLPVRYYDKDTTKPVSFYLSSLEELLAWTPRMEDGFNVALEPLACRQPPLSSQRPRTLLCHDMMGGYLDDRFIQGSVVQTPYAFYHWQCIDIFVYFSHHSVTIPPVGWTNAAHRHGVCVLGTFITEWNEGGRLCEAFLAGDERSYQAVADRLVQIAQFFRFDGWLINIENSLSLAAVGNTPPFLRYLTTQLHRQVPGGLVLWYDSVVQSGQLKWQDELNQHNRVFFDSCDGFFTNYNWREEHLERMLGQAGERRADVYVGVDVFARGNVVGGRFDTDKSLELIRKHGFSVALFAPGWVYECLEKKDFFQNQDKFWGRLERYLPTHSICSLPFVTSFCLGMGARRVCYGQEEAVGPWYHLSAQEIQPLFGEHRLGEDGRGWVRTHCCLEDAWHGGSSLLVRGVIPPEVGNVAVSCYEVSLRGCLLLDLLVCFSRPPGSREEESFTCRLGEIQVVDAASLLAPLPQVETVTISQVHWQPAASEREGPPALLQLSCTLHWSFLLSQVRCFRIHYWGGTSDGSLGRELPRPEMPTFLGLAFATQYRIVDLLVEAAGPGQDHRVEFLVEPVLKEGFRVPQAEWGRAALLYSAPA
ncbi:cytosolic endo-beta-N-acetylglucosaminidase isoform X3 [Trachypithecus francoisi]|uniref:cytosolic endo-beta-N-acetylglucosaminidase isoform X3 n=1 Tax=Trachypithecus francoisi TaxID=54180 RepID=UPI00141B611F|nr:cytosolic endo-beta-N-acetylglucosaminidase isoform X3 [Trachypithecus francoisi]